MIETNFMSTASSSQPGEHPDAGASMRLNGRSFWFASRFLPRAVAADTAELYSFCRTMDDLADDVCTPEALARLRAIQRDLPLGRSKDPCASALIALALRYTFPMEAAEHLVSAFVEDGSEALQLQTEVDLVRYSFGVAGTVGLMMSPLLGVTEGKARMYAADLGIAMQMTNIARDVMEDARNGRRYLPGDWVADLSPQQIVRDISCRQTVSGAIGRLLNLADRYYASASLGFASIPYRSRVAIEVSAAIYREIGVTLQSSNLKWWGDRTVVATSRKLLLACHVIAGSSRPHHLPDAAELRALHHALAGLPGTR